MKNKIDQIGLLHEGFSVRKDEESARSGKELLIMTRSASDMTQDEQSYLKQSQKNTCLVHVYSHR